MRKLLTITLTRLFLMVNIMSAKADVPSTALNKIEQSTVILYGTKYAVQDNLTGASASKTVENNPYCAGWVYYAKGNYALIITAKHCAGTLQLGTDYSELTIIPQYVKFFDGDVGEYLADDGGNVKFKASPDIDAAVFIVKTGKRHFYGFMNNKFYLGQNLYVFGNPNGRPFSLSNAMAMQGKVDNTFDNLNGLYYEIECASCSFGNSGGAVYNGNGDIVGMVVIMAGNAFYLIPDDAITIFLNQVDIMSELLKY